MPKSLICPVCDNFRTHTENAFVGHWKSRHAKLEFPHQILERRRRLDATQTEDVEEDDDDDMEEVQDGVGVGTRGVGKFEPREEEYGSDMDMDYDEGYGPAPRLVSLLPNHPMPIPRNPSPFEGWAPSFGFSRLQPQPSHNQPQRRASDYESSSSSSSRPPSPQHSSEGRRRRYHPAPLPPATPPPPIPGPTLAPLMNHYVAANQNSSTRRHSLPLPSFASMFPYDTGTGAGGLASGHHRPGFAPPRKVSMPVPTLLRRESDVLIKMEEEDMY
ncbi:hypothetical protein DL96DRAFT_1580850 [Flagelloscypha sp. PMI_526]|nr:hypothetical protein DL96DRAFT_1580850 [Flagelloscypha sp. PMI_526]